MIVDFLTILSFIDNMKIRLTFTKIGFVCFVSSTITPSDMVKISVKRIVNLLLQAHLNVCLVEG